MMPHCQVLRICLKNLSLVISGVFLSLANLVPFFVQGNKIYVHHIYQSMRSIYFGGNIVENISAIQSIMHNIHNSSALYMYSTLLRIIDFNHLPCI